MIICPKQKLGFVHVFKTGGSSITRLLAPYTVAEYRQDAPILSGPGWQVGWHFGGAQHSTFRDNLEQLNGLFDDDWRFVVVSRNPLTWLASVFYEFYHFDLGYSAGENFAFGQVSRTRSIEDFIQFYYSSKSAHPRYWGFYTQKYFVEGIPQNKLLVIKFENFLSDVTAVFGRFGIPADAVPHELQRHSKTAETISKIRRDPQFREFVSKEFAEDFDYYGYPLT